MVLIRCYSWWCVISALCCEISSLTRLLPPFPLILCSPDLPTERSQDARGFIGAVIQHRALAPAKRSLGGLLAAKRWHAHLGEDKGALLSWLSWCLLLPLLVLVLLLLLLLQYSDNSIFAEALIDMSVTAV